MLRIKKLIVHYGPFMALNEISLEVKEREVVALVGPNKAGKTTLLLTLSGILETTEGRVFFREEDITNLDPYKIVSKGLGHVPQGRHIFPTISVFDNLMVGAYIRRKTRGEIKEDLADSVSGVDATAALDYPGAEEEPKYEDFDEMLEEYQQSKESPRNDSEETKESKEMNGTESVEEKNEDGK